MTEHVAQLAQEIYNCDLFKTLIQHLHKLDFEVMYFLFIIIKFLTKFPVVCYLLYEFCACNGILKPLILI